MLSRPSPPGRHTCSRTTCSRTGKPAKSLCRTWSPVTLPGIPHSPLANTICVFAPCSPFKTSRKGCEISLYALTSLRVLWLQARAAGLNNNKSSFGQKASEALGLKEKSEEPYLESGRSQATSEIKEWAKLTTRMTEASPQVSGITLPPPLTNTLPSPQAARRISLKYKSEHVNTSHKPSVAPQHLQDIQSQLLNFQTATSPPVFLA